MQYGVFDKTEILSWFQGPDIQVSDFNICL